MASGDSSSPFIDLSEEADSPITPPLRELVLSKYEAAESADSISLQTEVGNTSIAENTHSSNHLEYQSRLYISDTSYNKPKAQESSRPSNTVHFHDLKPDALLGLGWSCIATRWSGGRCRLRIPNHILQSAVHQIMKIRTSISNETPSEADLGEVAKLLLCKKFHQYHAVQIAKAWSEEISVSSSLNVSYLDKDIDEKALPATSDSVSINSRVEFSQSRGSPPSSIISALVKCMRKPLAMTNELDGSIYMFNRPGTPSMIKIGSTKRDVSFRLQQYAKTCHYKPNLISHQSVHGYMRTESLIYISLREQRRTEENCNSGKGCHMRHLQWFEIDDTLALLTVQRWTEWMNLKPYISGRLDAFWETNLFEAEQLQNLDAFHQWIESMTKSCIEKGETSWRGRTDISPVPSIVSTDVPSLVSDTTLSTTLTKDRITSAVEEFSALLLNDEVIQRLQVIAFEKIGSEKFERNFLRLLKIYSKDLKAEALTPLEIEAVRFVRTRASYVANCVRSHIEPVREQQYKNFDIVSRQEPDRHELLERYLVREPPQEEMNMLDQSLEVFQSPILGATTKEQSSDYSELSNSDIELDDTEMDEVDMLSLPYLGMVKEFMITSQAFGKLRENLRDFVFPPGQQLLSGEIREIKKSANLNSTEENEALLKPDHVEMDVNMVGFASDVADMNAVPSSTFERGNVVELYDDVAVKENNVFNDILETSTVSSVPKLVPHRGYGSATTVSQRSDDLVITGTSFWKCKEFISFSAFQRWIRARWNQALRPRVEPGYVRIEWTCDCGEELYGDFDNSNPQAVSELAAVLQGSASNDLSSSGIQSSNQGGSEHFPPSTLIPAQSTSTKNNSLVTNAKDSLLPPPSTSTASIATISEQQYLALCVNTSEFRKTLAEVEVSDVVSDAELFERLKSSYRNARGFRARFSFLIQPTALRFVRASIRPLPTYAYHANFTNFVKFVLFDLRGGFVDICDTENLCSIPPANAREYRYRPIPLEDLPPMPSNVFLHFLKYGNSEGAHQKRVWFDRLPKRLNERVIDFPADTAWGWGIYVIEGPNKSVVFWITMGTMFVSVLASILWSSLRGDIQGGTGLGSMIIALPPVIMAAFLFKLTTE